MPYYYSADSPDKPTLGSLIEFHWRQLDDPAFVDKSFRAVVVENPEEFSVNTEAEFLSCDGASSWGKTR